MIIFDVSICAFSVIFIYLIFRALFRAFAKREIQKSDNVKRKASTLQIYANAESLEYYIRMSLSAEPRTTVIVNIDRNSADADELEYIAGVFARRTKNLKIHYIS